MSLKGKFIIGCACLTVFAAALWISAPKSPAPAVSPPVVADNSPVVTYTFEQQKESFKPWLKEFELKNTAVNEHWKELAVLLEDPEQEGIEDKLDAVQQSLEKVSGTYSSIQLPKELTEEQQKTLKLASHSMDESIASKIKYIRYTRAYQQRQRLILYRQSKDEKNLAEIYKSSALSEVNKLKETFKIE